MGSKHYLVLGFFLTVVPFLSLLLIRMVTGYTKSSRQRSFQVGLVDFKVGLQNGFDFITGRPAIQTKREGLLLGEALGMLFPYTQRSRLSSCISKVWESRYIQSIR